jgi:hypothetical protein
MRRVRLLALVPVASLLSACGPSEGVCDDSVRHSVIVRVVNTQGFDVMHATITYTVNGGPVRQANCSGPAGNACREWVAGFEEVGIFVLNARNPEGTRRASETVTVQEGICRVDTQQVTLTLPDEE